MSLKEWDWITQERVKEHFKPKPKKESEKVINLGQLKFFIGMCEANKRKFIPKEPPSNYDRQIMKSYAKKQKQSRSSSSDVPQLGAQKNQIVEPLIVEQTTKQTDLIAFLKEANLTAAQVARGQDISKAQVIARWQFQLGASLGPPPSPRSRVFDANENMKATRLIHDHDVPVRLHEWRED